jgi:hypothetical protein
MHVTCVPNLILLRIIVFRKSPLLWKTLTNERSFHGVLSNFDTVDDNSVMKHLRNLKIDPAPGLDACYMCAKFDFVQNHSFPEKTIIIEHVDERTKLSWGFE